MSYRKYNAKKCVIDDIKFDSLLEGERYKHLKLLQQAGKIWGLRVDRKRYPLKVGNKTVGHYVPDFEYSEPDETGEKRDVIEDVKGVRTAIYRLKRKMFEAQYMTPIREITKKDVRR